MPQVDSPHLTPGQDVGFCFILVLKPLLEPEAQTERAHLTPMCQFPWLTSNSALLMPSSCGQWTGCFRLTSPHEKVGFINPFVVCNWESAERPSPIHVECCFLPSQLKLSPLCSLSQKISLHPIVHKLSNFTGDLRGWRKRQHNAHCSVSHLRLALLAGVHVLGVRFMPQTGHHSLHAKHSPPPGHNSDKCN